ncbi:MAG: hypothetical protein AB7D33_05745 [Sphingobium sp.]
MIWSVKGLALACILAAVASLLSMGALGGLLYLAGYPVLGPLHGDMVTW